MNNAGIVFDEHYSHTLLRCLLGKDYPPQASGIPLRRSLPRTDVLATLLLFGKAYLQRPYWLHGLRADQIRPYRTAGLIDWIPDCHFEEAFNSIGKFTERLHTAAFLRGVPETVSLDSHGNLLTGEYQATHRRRWLEISELEWDLRLCLKQMLYFMPIIRATLSFRGAAIDDPAFPLMFPFLKADGRLVPVELFPPVDSGLRAFQDFQHLQRGSFLTRIRDLKTEGRMYEDDEFYYQQALVLDSVMGALAAERFASIASLPVKSATRSRLLTKETFVGHEEYLLFRIQFRELRYPVVETVDDVLRLREDPRLHKWRNVIGEYALRLRRELEGERQAVLREFRRDLQAATRDLRMLKRWKTYDDWCFYLSIPLAVMDFVLKLPLSSILVLPATAFGRRVAERKRNSLDWILFGRPR